MQLTFVERVQFSSAIPNPNQGTILTLLAIRALQKKIFFSPEEVEEYEMKTNPIDPDDPMSPTQTTWNREKVPEVFKLDLSKTEKQIIFDHMKDMDSKGLFPSYLLDRYSELEMELKSKETKHAIKSRKKAS